MIRIFLMAVLATRLFAQNVTADQLNNALEDRKNWLTYWGDYSGVRHRELDQINTGNVQKLQLAWQYQTGRGGSMETVPLVVDGVMYVTAGDGAAMALDAKTGRRLWEYKHRYPDARKPTAVNRGFAILGSTLFMVTPDSQVIAIEASTGKLIWQAEMAPWKDGTHYATLAPLVVKDKVIVGISGGEQGVRGFIDAYDAKTGKRVWRFWTVPLRGEKGGDTWLGDSAQRGGGPVWMTGTYDPKLNLTYWGVGNPGPDLYGDVRKGDNLYSCSLVALNPDTGKLKWHFQFTPHDTHDWDAAETPMLLDLPWQGKPRKLVVQANRNAFYYVLDRETGEFLMGKPFMKQTWAKGLDDKGRPILLGNAEPTTEGNRVCPGLAGGANWMAPSYNPQTKLFYFQVRDTCDIFYAAAPVYVEGRPYWGSVFRGVNDEKESGMLMALDPVTGEQKWTFRYNRAPWAGTLSTSGGLIFSGDEDGYLMAFDAKTGKNLWKVYTGARLVTAPITYLLDGKQYLTMPAGAAVMTFVLPE